MICPMRPPEDPERKSTSEAEGCLWGGIIAVLMWVIILAVAVWSFFNQGIPS